MTTHLSCGDQAGRGIAAGRGRSMIMSDESLSSGTKGAPRGEGDSLVYDTLHAIFSFHSNDDDRKFYMMNYGICAGEPGSQR